MSNPVTFYDSVLSSLGNFFAPLRRLMQTVNAIYNSYCFPKEGSTGAARFIYRKNRITHVAKSIPPGGIMKSIRDIVGQTRLLGKQDPHTQTFNEFFGYCLSKTFGFDLVAPTTYETGKEESEMEYLKDHSALTQYSAAFRAKTTFNAKEIELWQKLSIFNFLLGNLDPHQGNTFVKFEKGILTDVKMIDLGNSMPDSNPEWGYSGHMGDWGNYPIAHEPFSDSMKAFITNGITYKNLNAFILWILNERPDYMTDGMDFLLRQRWIVLKKVANGEILTPYELSRIRTDSDYTRVLK